MDYNQNAANVLEEIEQMREKQLFRKRFLKFMLAMWIFLIFFGQGLYGMQGVLKIVGLVLLLFDFIGLPAIAAKILEKYVNFKKLYKGIFKSKFASELLSEKFENISYCENVTDDVFGAHQIEQEIFSMEIIQTTSSYMFMVDDIWQGDYNRAHFNRASVQSIGDAGTFFKGHIYCFEFNEKVASGIQIRSKKFNYPVMPNYLKENRQRVPTGDSEFNSRFEVYAIDQQEALHILTPKMMDSILKIDERCEGVCINIVDNKIILAKNCPLDGMDAAIKQRLEYENERRKVFNDVREIEEIVDSLEVI